MLVPPSEGASKAMCRPSGDHRGVPALSVKLMRLGSDPSALLSHTCQLPERLDIKAMRLPSGENCGPALPLHPEMIVRTVAARRRWPPARSRIGFRGED